MWQSWENTKTYELKDCTVDELIQFIENKYTINPNCRFFLRFNIKNHERTILCTIKCHIDYYDGLVVGITPTNCKGERCPVKSSTYHEFIERMIKKEENSNYYN